MEVWLWNFLCLGISCWQFSGKFGGKEIKELLMMSLWPRLKIRVSSCVFVAMGFEEIPLIAHELERVYNSVSFCFLSLLSLFFLWKIPGPVCVLSVYFCL